MTFGSKGQGWDKKGVKDDNAGKMSPEPCLLPSEPSKTWVNLPEVLRSSVTLPTLSRCKSLLRNSPTPTLTLPLVSTPEPSRLPSVLLLLLLPSLPLSDSERN